LLQPVSLLSANGLSGCWLLADRSPESLISSIPFEASAVWLVPIGVVAAVWLHLHGQRWALPLAVIDFAIVVLTQPLMAWLGVLAALGWLVVRSGLLPSIRIRVAAAASILAALALLAGGASLGAATPPAVCRLADLSGKHYGLSSAADISRPGRRQLDLDLWAPCFDR